MRKYLRHHNGTVHSVEAEQFFIHLAQARTIRYEDKTIEPAREATPAEVAAYWEHAGFVYIAETDEALTPEEAAARAPKPSAKPAEKPAKDA